MCAATLYWQTARRLQPIDLVCTYVTLPAACIAAAAACSHCLDYRQLHYHAWLAGQCGPDVSRLPNWRAVVLHGAWLLRWLYLIVTRRAWGLGRSHQVGAA